MTLGNPLELKKKEAFFTGEKWICCRRLSMKFVQTENIYL